MKKTVFLTMVFMAVISCTPIRFDSLPGQKLNEIPLELTGSYFLKESYFVTADSLTLNVNQANILLEAKNERINYGLESDFVIFRFRDYYLIGKYDNIFKSLYNIMVVERLTNGNLRVYSLVDDKKMPMMQNTIERYLISKHSMIDNFTVEPPQNVPAGSGDLMIAATGTSNPNNQIMVGYMGMDEMQFESFLKLELKNYKPITLINLAANSKNNPKTNKK
ncbi:MAG: hypothetical protein ACK4K9_08670 [Bacteroidia bacterium]